MPPTGKNGSVQRSRAAVEAQRGDGLPELRPLASHVRLRERGLRLARAARLWTRPRAPGARGAGVGGAHRLRAAPAVTALRRPAAAGGAGAHARDPAAALAPGRAALQPRRPAAGADAAPPTAAA